jgi:hypothetical protein
LKSLLHISCSWLAGWPACSFFFLPGSFFDVDFKQQLGNWVHVSLSAVDQSSIHTFTIAASAAAGSKIEKLQNKSESKQASKACRVGGLVLLIKSCTHVVMTVLMWWLQISG